MMQIPCKHYNFGRDKWYTVNEWDGLKFFYTQILTGDTADNIIGLHRVGPKTAEKMLDGATTEQEMFRRCVEAYGGDTDRVVENARLLWLRREEGELWQPPDMR
jgi:5'-3' exonuclease